jgi:hypothetical protein
VTLITGLAARAASRGVRYLAVLSLFFRAALAPLVFDRAQLQARREVAKGIGTTLALASD